jgi:putative SOS response-associated peptidase YedK
MCGRYALIQTNELAERFTIDDEDFQELADSLKPRYNVAPEQIMPVVTRYNDTNHLELMQWGFMPPWAREPRDVMKYNTFNARSEGIFDKALWRRAVRDRRCLVPASGFYEWQQTALGKQPYYIHAKESDICAFAGVYRYWEVEQGAKLGTYSILTTTANHALAPIHHRMPVILDPTTEDRWLDPAATPETLQSLLRPYTSGWLDIYAVDKAVNVARLDGATLLNPINSK